MKKTIISALLILALFTPGCVSPTKFEPGGKYAQSETAAAMPELYVTDSAFDLSFEALDMAFKFEKNNRLTLWAVSPKIKHSLDDLRPAASQAWLDYAVARQAYLQLPTAGNLTPLQAALGKLQQLNNTALTVIANKGGK